MIEFHVNIFNVVRALIVGHSTDSLLIKQINK